jgi:hypothetical protein
MLVLHRLDKNGLGDFFTNSSGHPDSESVYISRKHFGFMGNYAFCTLEDCLTQFIVDFGILFSINPGVVNRSFKIGARGTRSCKKRPKRTPTNFCQNYYLCMYITFTVEKQPNIYIDFFF